MKRSHLRCAFLNWRTHRRVAFGYAASLSFSLVLHAQQTAPSAPSQDMTNTANTATQEEAPKISNDQLDSLVAPIALYPDPLLAQLLAASTYPLEVIELEQWLKRNPNLKDKALADAVAKQPWDPSIQAMAIFPDLVTRLSANVAWTTNLGNAFLAQQQDVMDAVQRMRAKAQSKGALQTTEQQKVETETVEGGQEAIVIEPANPQYVYVPSYDPAVVYGPPGLYPYPAYYYPGYVPGAGLAFGTGLILGAAWANNWGNCNWGHGDITINNNNNFNRNNINNVNRGQQGEKWQHNAQHRGGAPYGDRNTANKYGGRARQQPAAAANRAGGAAGLAGGAGNRPGGGGTGNIGAGNRPGSGRGAGGGAGNVGGGNRPSGGTGLAAGAGTGNRPGGGSNVGARSSTGVSSGFGGSGNNIGNRSVSSGSGFGSSSNAFGGAGFSGSSARSASSRGGHSMGGGGFSGGGRAGGGGRGGGGGRR